VFPAMEAEQGHSETSNGAGRLRTAGCLTFDRRSTESRDGRARRDGRRDEGVCAMKRRRATGWESEPDHMKESIAVALTKPQAPP